MEAKQFKHFNLQYIEVEVTLPYQDQWVHFAEKKMVDIGMTLFMANMDLYVKTKYLLQYELPKRSLLNIPINLTKFP